MTAFRSLISNLQRPIYIPRMTSSKGDIVNVPEPSYIVLPFEFPGQNFYQPTVKIGDRVRRNQIVGRSALGNCIHASISGIVKDILAVWSARGYKVPSLLIERTDDPPCSVEEIYSQYGLPLDQASDMDKLKVMGVRSPWNTPGHHHQEEDAAYPEVKKVIVKGINEESTIFVFEQLLKKDPDKIKRGFEYINRLAPKAEIYLTLPEQDTTWAKSVFESTIKLVGLGDNYIDRIEQMIVSGIAKFEMPNQKSYREYGIGVISTEYLLALVDALDDSGPFIYKHASIAHTGTESVPTVKFPIGMTTRGLLRAVNLDETNYARILAGGPMKGMAQYTTLTPLTKFAHGLFVLGADEITEETDFICTNCGDCTRACPVNLQVHLLDRYAEFSLFDQIADLHPEACNECGICSYVCPAHRSLVQFIQLCKKYCGLTYEHTKSSIQCSPESTLEKWEKYFQNATAHSAGSVAGSAG